MTPHFSTRRRRPRAPSCRVAALLALALALAGCATPPETTRPALALPTAWAEAQPPGAMQIERDWWRSFHSDELSGLIEAAQAGNTDLAIATERVLQAEIAARSAGASLFPQLSVGANSVARVDDQGSGFNAVGSQASNVSVGVSYEIDLWGRVAAVARGAQAGLRASRYDRETVRLSLTSGVASGYFQVLALRMRLVVAQQNLAIAEKVLAIVEARHRHGVATALDLSRQRTTVLAQRSALLPLEVQERQTVSALAILLGRAPETLTIGARSFDTVAVPEAGAGLPASLLTRRPDLASAEAALAGADADVAAARAALLPTVSLSASAGLAGAGLVPLGNAAYGAEIALSFLRTLFDADRLRDQVDIDLSSRRQLVQNYRAAVHAALKDVEDALGNVGRNRAQERVQQQIKDEAQRTLQLSERRYREGADDLNTLLDAQRTLFSADDALAQLRLSRLTAAIDLFKALGGGWDVGEPTAGG